MLKKTTSVDGSTVGYRGIEATLYAFGIITDCIQLLETRERPMLHTALQSIHQALQKLYCFTGGGAVWRIGGKNLVQPSIYSRKLYRTLPNYLFE